jgi:acid phosphatase (class A)
MTGNFLHRCLPGVAVAMLVVWATQPAPAASPTASPSASSEPHDPFASQIDIVALLPPPPAPDSPAQQADLQAVLEAQRSAHADGTLEHAVADVQQSCGRFSDALGDDLTSTGNSKLLAFLDQSAHKGALISGPAKRYWKRTRPYAYSAEVERLGDMAPQSTPTPDMGKAADEIAHSSYPSGHATFGTICAILLAEMVPEKRAALFARNRDYDHSRMVVGAHFPTDLEAGRIAGTLGAQLLLQDPAVRRGLQQARSGLRASLGLPPIY